MFEVTLTHTCLPGRRVRLFQAGEQPIPEAAQVRGGVGFRGWGYLTDGEVGEGAPAPHEGRTTAPVCPYTGHQDWNISPGEGQISGWTGGSRQRGLRPSHPPKAPG